MKRRNSRSQIRMIAGLYVAFLGGRMMYGMLQNPESARWYFISCAVAFIIFGIGLAILSFREARKIHREELEEEKREAEATKAEAAKEEAVDAEIKDAEITEETEEAKESE